MQIAIVGAGPIGLEAALAAVERGHDVTVFERGRVAENLRDWGHVRLFSPLEMNTSERGRTLLREERRVLPPDDTLLTGRDFVAWYLVPFAETPALAGRIRDRTEVLSIGRRSLTKGDEIGRATRARDPFRLLVRDDDGERVVDAEVVLDCSGTYGNHRCLGAGGMACPGERGLGDCIEYGLPDVLGEERERFADRTTCVIGSGYSAATAVVALAQLATEFPVTRVQWLTRSDRSPPIAVVENDVLKERARLANRANRLATERGGVVTWLAGRDVESIGDGGADGFVVKHRPPGSDRVDRLPSDNVIANIGYKPDRSIYEELQVHECYASQGPMKLAASLLGETSGDCLAMEPPGPAVLRNPEPNFFVLGSKSYGRDSRFLLRTGLQQVEDVFQLIEK